jgi:anti-anti-sigma factor
MSVSPVNNMVIVMAVTADQYAVCVRLAGDIDLAAEPDLARLADNLARTRCCVVHIDLHPVTFAGSTLINFLFRLAYRLPGHTSMTLCRPGAMTRQLIELTSVNEVALVRADLPADWTAPSTPVNVPVAMHAVALA